MKKHEEFYFERNYIHFIAVMSVMVKTVSFEDYKFNKEEADENRSRYDA